jgi:hypothetical protein
MARSAIHDPILSRFGDQGKSCGAAVGTTRHPIQPRPHVSSCKTAQDSDPRACQPHPTTHHRLEKYGLRCLRPRRPRCVYPGRQLGRPEASQVSGPSSGLQAQPRHRARQRWFTNARPGRRGGEPHGHATRRRRRARRGACPRRGQSGRRRRQGLRPSTLHLPTFIFYSWFVSTVDSS